jgi:hypothetical protein
MKWKVGLMWQSSLELLKSNRIDEHTTMGPGSVRKNRPNSEAVRECYLSGCEATKLKLSAGGGAVEKLAHRHRHGVCVCLDGRFLEPSAAWLACAAAAVTQSGIEPIHQLQLSPARRGNAGEHGTI